MEHSGDWHLGYPLWRAADEYTSPPLGSHQGLPISFPDVGGNACSCAAAFPPSGHGSACIRTSPLSFPTIAHFLPFAPYLASIVPMTAPISLTPIFEAKLAHHSAAPPGGEDKPWIVVVKTAIYDLNAIKRAFWSAMKPWQIFDAERVIDIEHRLPTDVVQRVSDNGWLLKHVPTHAWFYDTWTKEGPRELDPLLPELKHVNDELRQYCKECVALQLNVSLNCRQRYHRHVRR
jgi:hypothetical protein